MPMAELDTNQDRLVPRNFFSSSSVTLTRRKSKDTAEDRGVGETPTVHSSHPARLRFKKKKSGAKKHKNEASTYRKIFNG